MTAIYGRRPFFDSLFQSRVVRLIVRVFRNDDFDEGGRGGCRVPVRSKQGNIEVLEEVSNRKE